MGEQTEAAMQREREREREREMEHPRAASVAMDVI